MNEKIKEFFESNEYNTELEVSGLLLEKMSHTQKPFGVMKIDTSEDKWFKSKSGAIRFAIKQIG